MGWFWAETAPSAPAGRPNVASRPHPPFGDAAPPHGCPMHNATIGALSQNTITPPAASEPTSGCPVPHDRRGRSEGGGGCPVPHERRGRSEGGGCPVPHDRRHGGMPADHPAVSHEHEHESSPSTLAKLNPLNFMFRDLSQARAPQQAEALPTSREESTIPRGDGDGNWEYPSPQQMYNALLRKGYTDTDVTAVESMVAVHNFLNEGAWSEIVEWERRFGGGLARGWQISRRGEENAARQQQQTDEGAGMTGAGPDEPRLIRFHGRPQDMTPKAAFVQLLGRVYPSRFATEPPFDRHDWYVARNVGGQEKQVRYVIDYYSGPPEPTGEPVFYLDVRPAMTPTGAVERLMRWGGDVWWRASGGEARERA